MLVPIAVHPWLTTIERFTVRRLEPRHAQGRPRPRYQPRWLHRPPCWSGGFSLHAQGLFDGPILPHHRHHDHGTKELRRGAKDGRRRIRRIKDEELRRLPFSAAPRAWWRDLRQRVPKKFRGKTAQTPRKKHLADGRRRTRARLPQRRPGR